MTDAAAVVERSDPPRSHLSAVLMVANLGLLVAPPVVALLALFGVLR